MGCASTKHTGAEPGGAAGKSPTLIASQAPNTQHRLPDVGSPHEATSSRGSPAKGAVVAPGVRFHSAEVCKLAIRKATPWAAAADDNDDDDEMASLVPVPGAVEEAATKVGSPHEATSSKGSPAKGAVAAPGVRFQAAEVCELAIPWTRKATPWAAAAADDDDDDDEMPSLVAVPGADEEAKTKAWFPCCDKCSGQGETQIFHPRDSDEVRFADVERFN
mmetsp:Transcript_78187/g.253822  ORF Transcript_78187/g.253822 Transcript_78187/m.253822 type:complete len:219 (-) Transcript_78187:141-797(-)